MRMLGLLLLMACEKGGSIEIKGPAGDDPVDTDVPSVEEPAVDSDPPVIETDPPAPPADPPVPAAPCGNDLDVHNGTVTPRLARVPDGGVFAGDLNGDGPHRVVTRNGRVPNPNRGEDAIEVTTYAPEGDGVHPLVILMPGFGAGYAQYEHFSRPLASHGFVVVGLDFPSAGLIPTARHDENAAEAVAVIDWALTEGPFAAQIDPTKIAALGHSLGGKIAFYAAALDARIDLVVGWDPQNSGGPPCNFDGLTPGDCNDFPVAPNCEARAPGLLHQLRAESLVFGAEDGLLTPDAHLRAENFYRGAPSPTAFVHMPDASHAAWVFDGPEAAVTRQAHTALLLTRLAGVTGLEAWLPGGAALAGAEGVARVRVK